MDLIRTVAIVGVLLLHAGNDLTANQVMNNLEVLRWSTVAVYQSFGRLGVPLFVMLTGALLLAPQKSGEGLGVFFKKRFSRIGLPFLFWAVAYFVWDFYVENQQVNPMFVVQGLLTGPYQQFWYIYMLIGLYLLTPFLRLMVAHANKQLFRYFFVVWFIGTAIIPFVYAFGFEVDPYLFLIPTFIGYFILGAYLQNIQVSRRVLVAVVAAGLIGSVAGTYYMAFTKGGPEQYMFQEYASPTTIVASIALFLLLNTAKLPNAVASGKVGWGRRLLGLISENTLAIFFVHLMVLYVLWHGFGGYALNGNTVNSIVGVPLAAGLTLLVCLVVVVPLKKVPYLKRLIG